jgi:N-acetylmuramoyl-L-alanine amidase
MPVSKINNIFLHCSDSAFGEVRVIEKWHKARGWKAIGYHYVVLNGRPFKDVRYFDFLDGQIQPGHALNDDPIFADSEYGAHVAGRNSSSLGICLIGTCEFTNAQLLAAREVIFKLMHRFELKVPNVLGHYEDEHATKTCPNIPMGHFRDFLEDRISVDGLRAAISVHAMGLGLK